MVVVVEWSGLEYTDSLQRSGSGIGLEYADCLQKSGISSGLEYSKYY